MTHPSAASAAPKSPVLHPETKAVHISTPSPVVGEPLSVPIFETSTYGFTDPDVIADAMTRPDGEYTDMDWEVDAPGLTETSTVPLAVAAAGLDLGDLVADLVRAAIVRSTL